MVADLPLRDCRVVITRAAHQGDSLRDAFEAVGAEVTTLPLLEIRPAAPDVVAAAIARARGSEWVVFASANAVESLGKTLEQLRPPGNAKPRLAVVGPATADALGRRGLRPDLVATRQRATGLVAELAPRLRPGDRVTVPQADDARPELVEGLAATGAQVFPFITYHKTLPEEAGPRSRALFATGAVGWVTFTSPRIVRHFVQVLGDDWPRRRAELLALSIGPVTSGELRRFEVEPAAEASLPTPEAMVRAVVEARHAGSGESRPPGSRTLG